MFKRVYVEADTPAAARMIEQRYEKVEHPDIYRGPELEKTEFEKKAITGALQALNEILTSLGLPPKEVSLDNIHILSWQEYQSRVDKKGETGGARAAYGHVYITREGGNRHFVSVLTHELTHLAGFFALNVKHIYDAKDKRKHPYISLRRAGLLFHGIRQGVKRI